jgi:hypothetical protein
MPGVIHFAEFMRYHGLHFQNQLIKSGDSFVSMARLLQANAGTSGKEKITTAHY